MVVLCLMPSCWHRTAHTAEVNCTPLSVTMTAGTPKREIHPATRASAQAVAVVEERGIASTHLVERSIIVMMWVWPSELACRGPTRSTWMWENRCEGTGMGSTGVVMLVVIFAF